MKSLYLWPDHAALSLAVLWLASVVFLWAAREPMLALLRSLGQFAAAGCEGLARSCESAAQELRVRARAVCWPRESSRRRAGSVARSAASTARSASDWDSTRACSGGSTTSW